ncbi:MAG TPA: YqaJ viral recombinase family protein [Sedimentisphaerales bacterium]|nr:YqaJ viral recombinase family protein [Sedimentisphaerales bacterium]
MTITATQRAQRQRFLGSSDLPVIMGVSPYSRTPADIYWSKVGPLEEESPTEAMQQGNYLEETLIRFAADQLGQEVLHEREEDLYHVALWGPGKGLFAANLDGLTADRKTNVECKYCNAAYAEGYGDEGTDQIPDHVLVQVQHQLYCANLGDAWVAAALSGYSLNMRMYHVPRDDELIETISTFGAQWWRKHVEAKVPPEGGEVPPIGVLKAISRRKGVTVELSDEVLEIVERRELMKAQLKELKELSDGIQRTLISALGDAEIGTLPDGRKITYYQYSRKGFDQKRLLLDHPELSAKYTGKSYYRTLYVK